MQKQIKILISSILASFLVIIFLFGFLIALAYTKTKEKSSQEVITNNNATDNSSYKESKEEFIVSYQWPLDKTSIKSLKCNELINGFYPLYYEMNEEYVVYIVIPEDQYENGYTIDQTHTRIYDSACKLLYNLDHPYTYIGNSINKIQLVKNILVINYHINLDSSTIRRIQIDPFEERYFSVLYPPSEYSD